MKTALQQPFLVRFAFDPGLAGLILTAKGLSCSKEHAPFD